MVGISAVVSVDWEVHHSGISDVYLPKVCDLTGIQTSFHTNSDEI